MNFVAALLLSYLPEGDAFGALVVLMQDRGLRRYYSHDMGLLQARGLRVWVRARASECLCVCTCVGLLQASGSRARGRAGAGLCAFATEWLRLVGARVHMRSASAHSRPGPPPPPPPRATPRTHPSLRSPPHTRVASPLPVQAHLWQLGRLMHPALCARLEAVGVLPSLYAASWLMTCFSSDFPASFSAR